MWFRALASSLLAVTLLMRATSSTSSRHVAVAPQQPRPHAAQPAVAIDLPSTVQASVQTAVDPLPAPPPKSAVFKHPRTARPAPKVALVARATSSPQPAAAAIPPPRASSNPLELELQ